MTFFKSIKKDILLVNVIYIAIGYLLLSKGSNCVELVVTILGYSLMVVGVFEIIRYFVTKIDDRYKRNGFILGVVLMALSIVILICRYSLSDIATVAFGVAIFVSGALKIQDAIDAKKIGAKSFGTYMILMIICFAFGTLVIINYFYFLDYRWLYIVSGIGMMFSGISDLISDIYLAIIKTKYEKAKEKDNEIKEDEEVETKEEEPINKTEFTRIDVDIPKDDPEKEEPLE